MSAPTDTAATRAGGPPPPRVGEVVRRLELALGQRIDGLVHGSRLGRLPGLGSEAGEARRYVPGDDPRRIDWNVTARAQTPHVRDAVAEREVESWLVVDLSASTWFGTARCTKRDLVVAAAGALALLLSRAGDRLGAHVLTPDGLLTYPARAGSRQARAVLDALTRVPVPDPADDRPRSGPDLADALARLSRQARRRGVAAVVSDFPVAGDWVPAMGAVAARHETLAVEVLDPRELDLPDVGLLVVADAETGEQREIRTSDPELRRRYATEARARRAATAAALRARSVDHLVLRTDRDATADMVAWIASRPRRLAHLRRQQAAGAGGKP